MSGVSCRMQLKWPSGHSRLKQGLHADLEPDDARVRRQRRREGGAAGAVERDQRPVERGGDVHQAGVVADHAARRRTSGRSPRRAWCVPHRLTPVPPARDDGSRRPPRPWPSRRARPASRRRRSAARARAKYSAGQRLAGPYSAPGHSTRDRPRGRRGRASPASPRAPRDRPSAPARRAGAAVDARRSSASAAKRSTISGSACLSSRRASLSRP